MKQGELMRKRGTNIGVEILAPAAGIALIWGAALSAGATPYTYNNATTSSVDNWSTGTGWDAAPVGGSATELRFIDPNTTVFGDGRAIVSTNDIPGTFQLNRLDLQGTQGTANSSLTILGGDLEFVTNGATLPVINVNAINGTQNRLIYLVANNLIFTHDTSITGDGGTGYGNVRLTGTLSGTGAITKTGNSKVYLGNTVANNNLNNAYAYSGDITIVGGTLGSIASSDVLTKGKLTIAGGAYDGTSNNSFHSLFGTSGSMIAQAGRLTTINYTGSDPAAGFTGSIGANVLIAGAGSGDLTFSAMSSAALYNKGTGTMTTPGVGYGGSMATGNPFATIRLTGTSGVVAGGGTLILYGAVVFAPDDSVPTDVVVAGLGNNSGNNIRLFSASTLKFAKGVNSSFTFTAGKVGHTALILSRNNTATLILDPVDGAGSLGSATGVKFTLLGNSTALPALVNGMANASMLVVDTAAKHHDADFVTYDDGMDTIGGTADDVGFKQASYDLTDTFAGSDSAKKVKNTLSQTVSTDTSAYALRNDGAISIEPGVKLTLGDGVNPAGLIMNGGSIAGGTLAFGASEAAIYVNDADATIAAQVSGSGYFTKFGAGTLRLTGNNSGYAGFMKINDGAVDVGVIGTDDMIAASTQGVWFDGGVIQGSGTFDRALGGQVNQVSWTRGSGSYGGASGGFAARGGVLTVALNAGSATPLIWGTTGEFISDSGSRGGIGVMVFGSDTSDSQVDFQNSFDLGDRVQTTSAGGLPVYYRTILVKQGTGADSAKISGAISSTVEHGLIKDGPGTLILSAANSYAGDTVVADGTLVLDATGSIGSTMISVENGDVATSLRLMNGNALPDTATLNIADGAAKVDLAGGVNEKIGALFLNGVRQADGIYGSSASGAPCSNDAFFSGIGRIIVGTGGHPSTTVIVIR